MPRDGVIIFGNLIGKLDMLRIECPKCGRSVVIGSLPFLCASLSRCDALSSVSGEAARPQSR